jgi:threonine 3-dehydrogenase
MNIPVALEDVLITTASPIGIMAAVAKHMRARHVVTTRTVNVSTEKLTDVMTELGMTGGVDVGLEMSDAPTVFTSMLDNMNNGGKIVMLGISGKEMAID